MLYRFTGKVGDVVNQTIDESFYQDNDVFVVAIREMLITNYTIETRVGAAPVFPPAGITLGAVYGAEE